MPCAFTKSLSCPRCPKCVFISSVINVKRRGYSSFICMNQSLLNKKTVKNIKIQIKCIITWENGFKEGCEDLWHDLDVSIICALEELLLL